MLLGRVAGRGLRGSAEWCGMVPSPCSLRRTRKPWVPRSNWPPASRKVWWWPVSTATSAGVCVVAPVVQAAGQCAGQPAQRLLRQWDGAPRPVLRISATVAAPSNGAPRVTVARTSRSPGNARTSSPPIECATKTSRPGRVSGICGCRSHRRRGRASWPGGPGRRRQQVGVVRDGQPPVVGEPQDCGVVGDHPPDGVDEAGVGLEPAQERRVRREPWPRRDRSSRLAPRR